MQHAPRARPFTAADFIITPSRSPRHTYNFVSALIVTAQNGFGRDVEPFLALSRETRGEEILWDAVKDLPSRKYKRTRLMYAAETGDVGRLRWLLARGARLELKDGVGWTALDHAFRSRHVASMRELLARGAMIKGIAHTLHIACVTGALDEVREQLARGAAVNDRMDGGWSPLLIACENGHFELVRELLSRGADVKATTNAGWTPLSIASEKGNLEVVRELLLARGAELAATATAGGHAPLFLASEKGHLEVVRELLARLGNATVNRKTKSGGRTPLLIASANGHLEVVEELLSWGAAVHTVSKKGETPISAARASNHPAIVELLRLIAD